MADILSTLERSSFVEFATLFRPEEGRMGVTVTFMAILELVREGLLDLVQAEAYGPLHVRSAGPNRALHLVASNDPVEAEEPLFAPELQAGAEPGARGAVASGAEPRMLDDDLDDDLDDELGGLEGVDDVADEVASRAAPTPGPSPTWSATRRLNRTPPRNHERELHQERDRGRAAGRRATAVRGRAGAAVRGSLAPGHRGAARVRSKRWVRPSRAAASS